MKRYVIAGAFMLVGGCNVVPTYVPQPLVLPSGGVGFNLRGVANYTTDRVQTEAEIRKVMEEACGGDIEFEHLEFHEGPSSIPMLGFNAIAACS